MVDKTAKKQRGIGRPFKPGESGNPAGRPKSVITMDGVLNSKLDKGWAADLLIEMAEKGNFAALKYIYDRQCGMPRQALEVTGADGGPIENVIYIDKALKDV